MSGGEFQYKQYEISSIADTLEVILLRQGKDIVPDDDNYISEEYYKKYPNESTNPIFSENVQNVFRLAILNLRVAFAFTHRIDYFMSGDDSEDSFLNRLNEDLEEVIKNDNKACGFSLITNEETD